LEGVPALREASPFGQDARFLPGASREDELLISEVGADAERLVAAGGLAAFREVFGATEPDFDVQTLGPAERQEICQEYIAED
jgi:hypothetical protein